MSIKCLGKGVLSLRDAFDVIKPTYELFKEIHKSIYEIFRGHWWKPQGTHEGNLWTLYGMHFKSFRKSISTPMASLRDAYEILKEILKEICKHLKNTSEFHTLDSSRSEMSSTHTPVIQCLI